jgi:hypothetical protein
VYHVLPRRFQSKIKARALIAAAAADVAAEADAAKDEV